MEVRQKKVFCLFRDVNSLETFFLSDLAQSDIFRCIITVLDENKKSITFQDEITAKYDIKQIKIPSNRRKKTFPSLIQKKTLKCLTELSPLSVIAAIQSLIKEK